MFFRNFGTLIAYVVGASVDYRIIPCIYVVVPIVFGITFALLPNTPRFHLQRGQIQVSQNYINTNICVSQILKPKILSGRRKFFEVLHGLQRSRFA